MPARWTLPPTRPVEGPLQVIARHHADAPPVDLDKIAHELGLKIYAEQLEDGVFGKLVRDSNVPSGFSIHVNAYDSPARKRFTIAHEISHYILHKDLINVEIVDMTMYRSMLSSEYETQANRLAAEILMPANLVKREFANDQDVTSLARKFDVSLAAMEIRLRGLRLI